MKLLLLGKDIFEIQSQAHHLSEGDVVVTEPGNLRNKFRHIFFACLAPWNGRDAKELKEIVFSCCKLASGNSLKTIVFPCLGTGGLGFPEEESAQAMMGGLALFAFDHPQSSLETIYISLHKKSSSCMMKWDSILKKMVQEYNELVSGVKNPIDYIAVTGTGESRRSDPKQHPTSISLPKDKARYSPTVPSRAPSRASANTSGWWSLPQIYSFSVSAGPAQINATPRASGRLVNDGVEVDIGLKLRVAVPWLKTVFSRFL